MSTPSTSHFSDTPLWRVILFYIGLSCACVIFSIVAMIFVPLLPFKLRHRVSAFAFCKSALFWARITLKLHVIVEGLENIKPGQAHVVMSKHASTWETFFLQTILFPQVQVIKRELLMVPFFGWALAGLKPIAIDRSNGKKALSQVIEQGTQRLQKGLNVVIFPEGTRVPTGQTKPFLKGGFLLATKSSFPILPIAHNAGVYWPSGQWRKKQGAIHVVIGKPIFPAEMDAKTLILETETWINDQVSKLPH